MPEGLLSGLRVVEVSSWLAGPVATLLLAEAGADVVKVEPPGGDPARGAPGFATWNRSKRAVTLDLHADAGRDALATLLASADVLVHGLRPSVAARAGVDDATVAARYPSLITCSILGWPHGHPDEDRRGYDVLAQAATGVMDEELGTRPGPVFLRFPYASWNAALLADVGILARLRVREAGGPGGPVHTSLFQGALAPMSKHWARAERPTPTMSFATLAKGANMVQLCRDGLGVVSSMGGEASIDQVPLFRDAVAQLPPDVLADPFRVTAAALATRDRSEWLPALWDAGVAVVPVAGGLGEILSDEQALANDYAITVEDPEWGTTVQAGHPFRVDPPLAVQRSAPRLGEHDDEVLRDAPWTDGRATRRPAGDDRARPLEGIKVLDFGMFLAGPYGPQLMADLGAEVVKVEATTGDRLRASERVFAGCQRGKRSVAVDLRAPETREVLEALVGWADVVHHNLRMPPARRLGLDPDTVRAINPSVVYCHVSSFGPEGPRRDWPGIDPTSQAMVGWMQEGAGAGNPPRWYRIGMTDDQCAMASVLAVLLALRHRDQTGEGADVRASILGAATLTTSETMLLPDGSVAAYPRLDEDQLGIAPGYRIYRTADACVAVAAVDELAVARLRDALGATSDDELDAAFAGRTATDALAALARADVDAERVLDANEGPLFDSQLYRDLALTVDYEHPVYGHTEQIGAAMDFGGIGPTTPRPVSILGQHTAEVLAEVGIPDATVARLAAAGLLEGPGLPGA